MKRWILGLAVIAVMAMAFFALLGHLDRTTAKLFSDIDIVLFCGGPRGGAFSSIVYNGARAAQRDLGCGVKYVWSDWDPARMTLQFKKVIDGKPDAICIMGHPGEEVLASLVDEAIRKGIIVTLLNVDLPGIRCEHQREGMGYVGQDVYRSGQMLAEGMVNKYSLGAGQQALVFGLDVEKTPTRGLRTKGCMDALGEAGLDVRMIAIPSFVEAHPFSTDTEAFVKAQLAENPHATVLILDHGGLTAAAGQHLESLGRKPGAYLVGGFDLSQGTVAGIQDGYVGLIHDQQPFLQGYLAVVQACISKLYQFAGLEIDTGVGLVDRSNVNVLADLAERGIR
jgi:simple sugar transport system substrate-binding protein